jgi:hypothetical protein
MIFLVNIDPHAFGAVFLAAAKTDL